MLLFVIQRWMNFTAVKFSEYKTPRSGWKHISAVPSYKHAVFLSPCSSPPQSSNRHCNSSCLLWHTGDTEVVFHSAALVLKNQGVFRDGTYVSELSGPGIHVIKELPVHCHPCPDLQKGLFSIYENLTEYQEFLGSTKISDTNYST